MLTGTVIVSCFIQTSALPSRIEMQGNDLTFFDDTYAQGQKILGDTSRLIFTHASGKVGEIIKEGFIWEKRGSADNRYDNVLSLYGLVPRGSALNYLFFGFEGSGTFFETNAIQFIVDHRTGAVSQAIGNGIWAVGGTTDGAKPVGTPPLAVVHNTIIGVAGDGYCTVLGATGTGKVYINAGVMPLIPGINFGDPGNKFGTFYGTVSACPLPTVPGSALEMLEKIPAPVDVGDRAHFGPGLYFDDLTFPAELLHTNSDGHVDIELTRMVGFLLQTVKELKAEVDFLKGKPGDL